MRAQAERFGAELVTEDITEMDLTGPVKTVTDGYGNTFARPDGDPGHGLGVPQARHRRRGPAVRSRRLLVCHL